MPYYFRCYYCNDDRKINPWDCDQEKSCEWCGEDCCTNCIDLHEARCSRREDDEPEDEGAVAS